MHDTLLLTNRNRYLAGGSFRGMLVGMSSDLETCDPTDQLRCLDQPKHTMYIGQLVQVEKRTKTAERVGSKEHLAPFFDSGGGGMSRIRKSEKM